ncbi:hypothetical protein ACJMK2_011248 [Sinanodonta woodiana]|uniref:C1q domain-containing protein n=1 Tax=Sinanodonta woodiana TaxID=1069815 RepID=A0ABD3V4J2_SINWO
MKRFFLLLVSGLICVSLSLAHNLERYPEVHQWQALLNQMDVFEKEHARYREQIELLEMRVKVAESKISEMQSLKIKLKTQEKTIARLNLLERRLKRAEHLLVCTVTDLRCEFLLKSDKEENAVKANMTNEMSKVIIYQKSNIHRLRSNKSKFIAEAPSSFKYRRDENWQVNVERRIDRTSRVAFSTYLSHLLQELGREHVIVFDQVEYNEGNGYDKLLGIFTCPVSGTYFFVASMLGFPNQPVHTEIVLDGSKTAGMDSDSTGGGEFPQGTNIAIFRCALGQRVWVRIIEHLGTKVYGDQDRFTKFAGFILWSDE